MNMVTIIGYVGGCLTSLSILPQVMKIYRLKSGTEVSLVTYSVSAMGLLCWLIYGLSLHQTPLILWNGIGLLLSCSVIALKLYFGKSSIKAFLPK